MARARSIETSVRCLLLSLLIASMFAFTAGEGIRLSPFLQLIIGVYKSLLSPGDHSSILQVQT